MPADRLVVRWSLERRFKHHIQHLYCKCKIMTISRRRMPLIANSHIGSADLKRVDSEVDLGVTLTGNLCWNKHISQIVSKANIMLGLLRRTCLFLTVCNVRRTLYLSLIKSQLCYAADVWSPSQYNNKTLREFKGAPQDGSSKRS